MQESDTLKDFILIMYDDATDVYAANDAAAWNDYFSRLHASGCFEGGSSIAAGFKLRKGLPDRPLHGGMNGFIRVRAENAVEARRFLSGNPAYEAGGTVELRELPRDE